MRYIGSKLALLGNIEKVVQDKAANADTFCDLFSGTACVARHFKKQFSIISNDFLYYSYVLQRATIVNQKIPDFNRIGRIIKMSPLSYFNTVNVSKDSFKQAPFIYDNYSPHEQSERMYFFPENALKIDFIRQTIEDWKNNQWIHDHEYYYLLAVLLEAASRVANVPGLYNRYLMSFYHFARRPLILKDLDVMNNGRKNRSYNQNVNEFITKIQGDILYLDPPYSGIQYAAGYHLLETIAKYDYPLIYGKTGLRPYQHLKSNYCYKRTALAAFSDLIEKANFEHIIMSYSNEGIMQREEIERLLKKHGDNDSYQLTVSPYKRYKSMSGDFHNKVLEFLFYIRKPRDSQNIVNHPCSVKKLAA